MSASFDDSKPIFQQVADMIEDDILNGTYQEEEQVMSVNQFVKAFQINPATVVKGMNLLVTERILYKKRGLGMFVATGAKGVILDKRRRRFFDEFLTKLLDEAEKLQLTKQDIIRMIEEEKRRG